LHLARIGLRKSIHCVVERHQVHVIGAAHDRCFIEPTVLHAASTFQIVAARRLWSSS
jgi:hypothetical protein